MGQKVNPNGLRLGITSTWQSTWFSEENYAKFVIQDENIRKYFIKNFKDAFISKVFIKRTSKEVVVEVLAARTGFLKGRDGEMINKIVSELQKLEPKGNNIRFEILEVAEPEMDAQIVAYQIAEQLINRANFRIVQKKAIRTTMANNAAKGIKTRISGRLNGVDMARAEGYTEGNVPLHTLRANIDYARAEALTTYGQLGVKVWIYKGEVLPTKETR